VDRQAVGTAQVFRADSRALPIADDTVDLVVTSPPYFAVRSYQDGGEHYDGQIGAEPTPAEFVDALLEVTRECVRVLKPSGSLWVNLGDKYAERGGPERAPGVDGGQVNHRAARPRRKGEAETGIRQKSLMGIPWRYAIRCIDELGLILRAEVIWSKPNGLPESVTDRVRRSHETWFHFTLQPRYFSAVDEIREEHKPGQSPAALSFARNGRETSPGQSMAPHRVGRDAQGLNPLGKLPGSVWTIPTEPLNVPAHLGVDHFAAFPTEWPRRIIQGWSPAGVCVECGEGRRPVAAAEPFAAKAFAAEQQAGGRSWHGGNPATRSLGVAASERNRTITHYACACDPHSCRACGEISCDTSRSVDIGPPLRCCDFCTHTTQPPTTPAVVLDPFGGTGTTALVAKALGRHGISVDMSADYCRLAQWRTNDLKQLAKAARREFKPSEQPIDGQGDLLSLLGEASA
jgi:DNA modification methylase